MTKQRHLRSGGHLDDDETVVIRGGRVDPDETVVIRGGRVDPDELRTDATRCHGIYGDYGISVFAARDIAIDELAQEPPLVRFDLLTWAFGVLECAMLVAGVLLGPAGPVGARARR